MEGKPRNRVEVTDRQGWRKDYPLTKAILHIGSDARNDIVLEDSRGAGVESRHAQLISAPGSRAYRLVNLSGQPISLSSANGGMVQPRGTTDVHDGDELRIGDYQLRFHGGGNFSNAIALRVQLPDRKLVADSVLEGTITVQNLGDVPGVQFKLAVEGLSSEWYELGPGPVLFPGAEKDVRFRLRHPRKPQPPAGEHVITVRASAADAYPGESAAVSQTIQIAPYFQYSLRLAPVDE